MIVQNYMNRFVGKQRLSINRNSGTIEGYINIQKILVDEFTIGVIINDWRVWYRDKIGVSFISWKSETGQKLIEDILNSHYFIHYEILILKY
jgi:hypothetical protein